MRSCILCGRKDAFFQFPSDIETRDKWVLFCDSENLQNLNTPPLPCTAVCYTPSPPEVEFLKSEELSLIKSSPLPAQLPWSGRS